MTHDHRTDSRNTKTIVGGGSITLETCSCGALRTVIERHGKTLTSKWELEPEDDGALAVLDLDPDNDND